MQRIFESLRQRPWSRGYRIRRDGFGTDWFGGIGSKAAMVEYGHRRGHTFFVAREVPNKHDGSKCWQQFASFPDEQAYRETLTGLSHDYEILEGPCRLMIDVDAAVPARDDDRFQGVRASIEAAVRKLLLDLFSVEHAGPCVEVDGSRPRAPVGFKHSYHISFPRIVFEDMHVAMSAFAKWYLVPALRDAVPFLELDLARLDAGIYTFRRNWRLVGSCKYGGGAKEALRMLDPDLDPALARCSGLTPGEVAAAAVLVTKEMVDALPQPRVFTWMSGGLAAARRVQPEPGRGVMLRRVLPGDRHVFRPFATRAGAARCIEQLGACAREEGAVVEIHELVQAGAPRYFALDVDWKRDGQAPASDEEVEATLDSYRSAVAEGFAAIGLSGPLPEPCGDTLRAVRPLGDGVKHSYHMHFGPATGTVFADERATEAFFRFLVAPHVPEELRARLDAGVYARNHTLRTAFASKLGVPGSALVPVDPRTPTEAFVLAADADAAGRTFGVDEVLAAVPGVTAKDRSAFARRGLVDGGARNVARIDPENLDAVARGIEEMLRAKGDPEASLKAHPTRRGMFVTRRKYTRQCIVTEGATHESNGLYCIVRGDTGEVEVRCHSQTCKDAMCVVGTISSALCPRTPLSRGSPLLVGVQGPLGFSYDGYVEGGNIARKYQVGGAAYGPDDPRRYLGDIGWDRFPAAEETSAQGRILCARSPMGTGKTHSLVDLIRETRNCDGSERFRTIVSLSPRIQFTKSTLARFEGMGFVDYNDRGIVEGWKGPLTEHAPRVIYQGESLWKLAGWIEEPVNLLVIDEIESFLAGFSSSKTHGSRLIYNARVFAELVRSSETLVAMDADLGARATEALELIVGKETMRKKAVLVHNTSPPSAGEVSLHQDFSTFRRAFEDALDDGKNIFAVTGARRFVEEKIVRDILRPRGACEVGCADAPPDAIRYRMYSAGADDAQMDDFLNPNESLSRLNVCVIAPKVTVGADITVSHFDIVFIVASHGSVCARTILQMSKRARRLTTPVIHVFVDKPMRGLTEATHPTTLDGALDLLRTRAASLSAAESEVVRVLREDHGVSFDADALMGDAAVAAIGGTAHELAWLVRVLQYNLVEANITKRALARDLTTQCIERGYTVKVIDKPAAPVHAGPELPGEERARRERRRIYEAANLDEGAGDAIRDGMCAEVLCEMAERVRRGVATAEDKALAEVARFYVLLAPGAVDVCPAMYTAFGSHATQQALLHLWLSISQSPAESYVRWREALRPPEVRWPTIRRMDVDGKPAVSDAATIAAVTLDADWAQFRLADACARAAGLAGAGDTETLVTGAALAEAAAAVTTELARGGPAVSAKAVTKLLKHKGPPSARVVREAVNVALRAWHSGELRPAKVVRRRARDGSRTRETVYRLAFPVLADDGALQTIADLLPHMR